MAGDSETHLEDRGEKTNVIRQPFLIGVSGGTASGKVGTPSSETRVFNKLSFRRRAAERVGSWLRVDRVASATPR